MEFTLDEYKRSSGKIYSSSDGFKYFSCKVVGNQTYLRCALFRRSCKGTAKLDHDTNLIHPKSPHNHDLNDYQSELFSLKSKCKKKAKVSNNNLREIFNQVTRSDPSASTISFKECESAMFRSRRKLQPKIPQTASEFCEILPTTAFSTHLKAIVIQTNGIGVIFFSDQVMRFSSDISDIQFDGTFHTVPVQFYQLWTIFFSMAIPFLPPELIYPTFLLLQIPNQNHDEGLKLQQFIKYFKKQWLTRTLPEELSIFEIAKGTNNSAESYHCQLKSRIQCSHPRIWNFLKVLDDIIADTDNEMLRLQQGREITRPRKNKDVAKDERRALCKEKLTTGIYTPLQYLAAIGYTVGNVKEDVGDSSEISEGEGSDSGDEIASNNSNPICVVCLQPRQSTWIFLPCRHANSCGECSRMIEQLQQSCPTCRTPIESRLEIFLN